MIQFRLKELIARKERIEGMRITYRTIQEQTGISTNTLTLMANNRMRQIGLGTIDRLCKYLDCDIGDLMIRVDD